MKYNVTLLAVLIACNSFGTVRGGVVSGHYKGSDTWVFIDKFCFSSVRDTGILGQLNATFRFPVTTQHAPQMFLYYKGNGGDTGLFDEWGSWERAYKLSHSCEDRYNVAQEHGNVFSLLNPPGGSIKYETVNGVQYAISTTMTRMSTYRARFFFVAIGNCLPRCGHTFCAEGIDIEYTITMTNGEGWTEYFSADKSFILETDLLFSVLYFLLLGYTVIVRRSLKKVRKYHPSVRLLVWSIQLQVTSLVFFTAYNLKYAGDGVERPRLTSAGIIFAGFSEFCLLLQIILVSKGWTIVRRKISASGRVKISVYLTVYICVYWACYAYYKYFSDPAEVVYLYGTLPGYLLAVLRVLCCFWVTYAVTVTVKKYKAKKRFYRRFWMFSLCWTASLPVLVCVNFIIELWWRAKLMNLLTLTVSFLTHLVLVIMYNPNLSVNANFPFHVTTAAMLNNNATSGATNNAQVFQGSNSFTDSHLRRAAELSQKMRQGATMLQGYLADLFSFVEEVQAYDKANNEAAGIDDVTSPLFQHTPRGEDRKRNSSVDFGGGPRTAPSGGLEMTSPGSSTLLSSLQNISHNAVGNAPSNKPRLPPINANDDSDDDENATLKRPN